MSDKATQATIRENIYTDLGTLFPNGVRVTEGLAVDLGHGQFATVKVTIKKEGFDVDAAIAEFQEKQAAAVEREAEKARKAEEKAQKAKAKEQTNTDTSAPTSDGEEVPF